MLALSSKALVSNSFIPPSPYTHLAFSSQHHSLPLCSPSLPFHPRASFSMCRGLYTDFIRFRLSVSRQPHPSPSLRQDKDSGITPTGSHRPVPQKHHHSVILLASTVVNTAFLEHLRSAGTSAVWCHSCERQILKMLTNMPQNLNDFVCIFITESL